MTYSHETKERAAALARDGLSTSDIAKALGVPYQRALTWLNPGYAERSRIASREAKKRRFGTCVICGGKTTLRRASRRGCSSVCGQCAPAFYAERSSEMQLNRGPVVDALFAWFSPSVPVSRAFLLGALGITETHLSVLLNRLVKRGDLVRVERGVYMLPTT